MVKLLFNLDKITCFCFLNDGGIITDADGFRKVYSCEYYRSLVGKNTAPVFDRYLIGIAKKLYG